MLFSQRLRSIWAQRLHLGHPQILPLLFPPLPTQAWVGKCPYFSGKCVSTLTGTLWKSSLWPSWQTPGLAMACTR